MMMFLLILFTSLPVVVLSCLMFKGLAPKPEEKKSPEMLPEAEIPAAAPRFFVEETPGRIAASRFPVEVLLSQIERHVRLEQAAAESHLDEPTRESLHSRTASPLLN
jgi:hypothetical protein